MGYFQKSGWDGIGWWMIDEWMMVDGMSVCSKKRVFFSIKLSGWDILQDDHWDMFHIVQPNVGCG